jgi:hypothetical protein
MKLASITLASRPMVALVSPEAGRVWPLDRIQGRPLESMLELIGAYDGA